MAQSLEDTTECSLAPADAEALRRHIKRLQEERMTLMASGTAVREESKQLMEACLAELQGRCEEVFAEEANISALGMEELEAFVERMRTEVHAIEEECRGASDEIRELTGSIAEESVQFARDLQDLEYDLDSEHCQAGTGHGELLAGEDAHLDGSFKVTELSNLMKRNELLINSIEDLQNMLKMHEAVDQIDDKFSDVKVLDIENNWFRLALKTHVKLDGLPKKSSLKINPFCLDHELLIEVNDETMDILDLKIFPADVSLDAVIDDSKSLQYPLEKVVRHVQQRILLCSLRSLMAKNANNLGRSVDYIERDDMMIAHLVSGVDVYLKMSHGWPVSDSFLTLVSVKTMSTSMEKMSLSLLREIKEQGNSLDRGIRWSLPGFLDAIEEIFVSKTHSAV